MRLISRLEGLDCFPQNFGQGAVGPSWKNDVHHRDRLQLNVVMYFSGGGCDFGLHLKPFESKNNKMIKQTSKGAFSLFFVFIGTISASLSLLSSFQQLTIHNFSVINFDEGYLDSNCRPLVSEATALSAQTQPLSSICLLHVCESSIHLEEILFLSLLIRRKKYLYRYRGDRTRIDKLL